MAESSSNQIRSAGRVVLGSGLISLSPFFVEFSGLSSIASSFYRMAIGGVVFFLIALFRGNAFPKSSLLGLSLLAAFTIALDLVTWNQSVLYIGAGLSTVLANLEIVFLVAIGILFYREKLPPLFLKMCALMACGVSLLIYPYLFRLDLRSGIGILFALAASLIYSIYLLLLKTIGKKNGTSTVPMLAMICLLGAAILGLCIFLLPSETFSIVSPRGLFCVLSNGLLNQVLGWLLITTGLKNVSLSVSGLLMLTQPALTFVFDCLFLGRNTEWIQILGCISLLAAVYGASRGGKVAVTNS